MKPIAKNKYGEYESGDLWYRRMPIIFHYGSGKINKILCSWIKDPYSLVLDFGCARQRSKKYLPKTMKYIGYDIIPEYSDVPNYKHLQPDIFFAIGVFEHLLIDELNDVLEWINITPIKQILITIPSGQRPLIQMLFGLRKKIIREHLLNIRPYSLESIYNPMQKYLKLKRKVRYFGQELSEWVK